MKKTLNSINELIQYIRFYKLKEIVTYQYIAIESPSIFIQEVKELEKLNNSINNKIKKLCKSKKHNPRNYSK